MAHHWPVWEARIMEGLAMSRVDQSMSIKNLIDTMGEGSSMARRIGLALRTWCLSRLRTLPWLHDGREISPPRRTKVYQLATPQW